MIGTCASVWLGHDNEYTGHAGWTCARQVGKRPEYRAAGLHPLISLKSNTRVSEHCFPHQLGRPAYVDDPSSVPVDSRAQINDSNRLRTFHDNRTFCALLVRRLPLSTSHSSVSTARIYRADLCPVYTLLLQIRLNLQARAEHL